MGTIESSVSSILLDRVAEWLTNSSLAGDELENIVRGFCERLTAAGLPLARVHLTFSMLHPLYDALSFTWRRASGVTIEGYRMPGGPEAGPLPAKPLLLPARQQSAAHAPPADSSDGQTEFPIFEDLRKESITDYLAFVQPFGDGSVQGMMGSWSTDQPRRLFRRHDRRAAQHAEPSGGRRQDGGAGQARQQHADHLSRRRRRQAGAERPDPPRRWRDDPRRPRHGRHARNPPSMPKRKAGRPISTR